MVRKRLWDAFKSFRHAGVNLVFAPFVALAAMFGLLVISFSYMVQTVEIIVGLSGWEPDLGSEFLYEAGKKQLPSFYF